MSKPTFYFVASTYFGTGEGMTHACLITYAYPRPDRDYKVQPNFDLETGKFDPGELKYPMEEVAKLEFTETFGSWLAIGADVLDEDEFFERYGSHVPDYVKKIVKGEDERPMPGNFRWYTQCHMNFS